jgi:hypothetical protein
MATLSASRPALVIEQPSRWSVLSAVRVVHELLKTHVRDVAAVVEVELCERSEATQLPQPHVRHLGAPGEVELGELSAAAHCSQPLVRNLVAPAEAESRERSQAAHCSHALVRQHAVYISAALVLELQRHHRREPPRQHAHGLVGGIKVGAAPSVSRNAGSRGPRRSAITVSSTRLVNKANTN